jgi:hypothetical protein
MRQLLLASLTSVLLLPVTAAWAAPAASRTSGAQSATISIDGKAQIARGEAAPKSVQLRSLDTGQLVATTTCNSRGDFSFNHRQPGHYAVELVNPAGAIVGSSAAIAAPGGATASVVVVPAMAAMSKPAPSAASTASIVTATAVAAGIPGVAMAGRHQPSPSF